jgi:hydroxymethylpyrimidine/phosphomethylpyrimidine kinase
MKKAARLIAKRGPRAVVVKGGHIDSKKVVDVAFIENKEKIYEKTRLKLDIHGAGCTFSSAIASFLARGHSIEQSIEEAEKFISDILPFSLSVGKGRKPLHQFAMLYKEKERKRVITEIEEALRKIKDEPDFLDYVATVGTQIAMALPFASSKQDIAAIEGRIVRTDDRLRLGNIKFGASTHMANVVLTAMKYNPDFRAAMNLHYSENLIKAFKHLGFKISSFDRKREPTAVKRTEGLSLIWGTEEAIRKIGKVPDIIFDLGEPGKEPMIRILGKSALDVVKKVLEAIRFLKEEH